MKNDNVKYPENREKRKLLKKGDQKRIADAVDCHPVHVRQVFAGYKRMTLKIEEAYNIIVQSHQAANGKLNEIKK